MIMAKETKLIEELNKLITTFKDESVKHKKMYRSLRYTSFILTGVATILASTALIFEDMQVALNITIVLVTSVTGVLASIEGLRKPAELWINERNIQYALTDLLREIEYETDNTGSLENPDVYFDRMQQILGTSKEKWSEIVRVRKDTKS
jgi:hypothetical protein